MYSRRIENQTFTFEPSGGLLNSSLVMMDKETDSHWSIITEEAIWGNSKGKGLEQIPGAVRTTWAEWRADHPETLVLSLDGKEHVEKDPYAEYYTTEKTFGEVTAPDKRFKDKDLIYAFRWDGGAYAVPHASFFGGNVVSLGDRQLFLYRQAEDSNLRSTVALLGKPGSAFEQKNGRWEVQGLRFDPDALEFTGSTTAIVEEFPGFDTYWYIWNSTNTDGEVLQPS